MITGRTDEPLTTDAAVRNARAQRMADMIRKVHGKPPVPDVEDSLAVYLARCLAAHETDTLKSMLEDTGLPQKRFQADEKK